MSSALREGSSTLKIVINIPPSAIPSLLKICNKMLCKTNNQMCMQKKKILPFACTMYSLNVCIKLIYTFVIRALQVN